MACSDSDNPDGYGAWLSAADAAEAQFGHFGRIWTWGSSACAEWSFEDADRFSGPFTTRTSNPVLVVANSFDPATPYPGAVKTDQLLPNSSLLTLEGWGHGSIGRSQCADEIIVAYLIGQRAPAGGAVCQQDFVPFAQAPPPLPHP